MYELSTYYKQLLVNRKDSIYEVTEVNIRTFIEALEIFWKKKHNFSTPIKRRHNANIIVSKVLAPKNLPSPGRSASSRARVDF